jgi:hypothetical protein
MKIYIASSWKNKHGVEMLTQIFREAGHEVVSWIENCDLEQSKDFDFEKWVNTNQAQDCFYFDTRGATTCDVFVYYGPAGKDACAELGAAWVSNIKTIGLYAKGEDLGLMRKMVSEWYDNYLDVVSAVTVYKESKAKKEENLNAALAEIGLRLRKA